MWNTINIFLKAVDDFVWGVPLMVLIMAGGIMLTVRLGLLHKVRRIRAHRPVARSRDGIHIAHCAPLPQKLPF